MKVLLLGCMLKTWENNILVFVVFNQDHAFTKNINFFWPHQMELLSANVMVMGLLR